MTFHQMVHRKRQAAGFFTAAAALMAVLWSLLAAGLFFHGEYMIQVYTQNQKTSIHNTIRYLTHIAEEWKEGSDELEAFMAEMLEEGNVPDTFMWYLIRDGYPLIHETGTRPQKAGIAVQGSFELGERQYQIGTWTDRQEIMRQLKVMQHNTYTMLPVVLAFLMSFSILIWSFDQMLKRAEGSYAAGIRMRAKDLFFLTRGEASDQSQLKDPVSGFYRNEVWMEVREKLEREGITPAAILEVTLQEVEPMLLSCILGDCQKELDALLPKKSVKLIVSDSRFTVILLDLTPAEAKRYEKRLYNFWQKLFGLFDLKIEVRKGEDTGADNGIL